MQHKIGVERGVGVGVELGLGVESGLSVEVGLSVELGLTWCFRDNTLLPFIKSYPRSAGRRERESTVNIPFIYAPSDTPRIPVSGALLIKEKTNRSSKHPHMIHIHLQEVFHLAACQAL